MTAIQPLLILLLLAGTLVYFRWLRSGLLDRLLVLLIAAAGVGLVINPELTTRLANQVGVGRGVDLIFYLALFGLGFSLLLIFSKLRDLEARLTEVARALALANVKRPADL